MKEQSDAPKVNLTVRMLLELIRDSGPAFEYFHLNRRTYV